MSQLLSKNPKSRNKPPKSKNPHKYDPFKQPTPPKPNKPHAKPDQTIDPELAQLQNTYKSELKKSFQKSLNL